MTVNNENGLRTYKSHSEEIAAEIFQSLRRVFKIVFLSADIILFCVEKKQNITYSREESSLLNWRYIKASFFIFKIHLLIQSCIFLTTVHLSILPFITQPFFHSNFRYSRSLEFIHASIDISIWPQLFKAGLRYPRVSVKFDFRSENFERKFSSNIFACNLIIGCSKKNSENFPKKTFEQRNKESWIKI